MHERIGIGCPAFAMRDPVATLEELDGRIARWEMLAEDRCALPEALPALKEHLPSYGIRLQVHAPFSDLNPAAMNPSFRELTLHVLEETLEGARELNAELVTVHPGILTPMGQMMREACVERNLRSMARLARRARDLGMRVAVENMPFPAFTLCNDAEGIREVLDGADIDDALGFCLDVGHANITGATGGLLGLRDRLFNVHLHDNDGRKDLHAAIGEGTVEFRRVLRSVLPSYRGPFIIEGKGTEHVCGSQESLEGMLSGMGGRF